MPQIVHFEVTAGDVPGLAAFYGRVTGWTAEPSPFLSGYTVLAAPEGATGAVMSETYMTQKVIVWFGVASLEEAIAAVEAGGGRLAGEIATLPGQGRLVYAADPEGTVFGLREAEAAPLPQA